MYFLDNNMKNVMIVFLLEQYTINSN